MSHRLNDHRVHKNNNHHITTIALKEVHDHSSRSHRIALLSLFPLPATNKQSLAKKPRWKLLRITAEMLRWSILYQHYLNINQIYIIYVGCIGSVSVRCWTWQSPGHGFNSTSSGYYLEDNCLQTGKPSQYINNTKVNSAFHPSGVSKPSTSLLAGIEGAYSFTCVE